MAQSFGSSSTESGRGCGGVCFCNRPTRILKAWTNENPRRRFCKCRRGQCNFFAWFDVEKPNGWQHVALLEARDVMRQQKDEIERLKKIVTKNAEDHMLTMNAEEQMVTVNAEEQMVTVNAEDQMVVVNKAEIHPDCEIVEREVLVLKREVIIMRNVVAMSWVGFAAVIGMTIALLK